MSSAPLTANMPKSFGTLKGQVDIERAVSTRESGPVTAIPKTVSQKLKVLMLAGTFAVVYIHTIIGSTYKGDGISVKDPSPWELAPILDMDIFKQGLLRFAVPMFFVVSGFLFFVHKPEDFPEFQYIRRIKARVTSVGVPYILWNIFIMVAVFALLHTKLGQDIYADHRLLTPSFGLIAEYFVQPIGMHLWYLRDLFILACLSPVFHGLFRVHELALLAVPAIAMWLYVTEHGLLMGWCPNCEILRVDGLVFFPLGAYLALSGANMEYKLPRMQFLSVLVFWCGCIVFRAVVDYNICEKTPKQRALLDYIHNFSIPFGVMAVWFTYDVVEPALRSREVLWTWILWMSNYCMWIYCAHQPWVMMTMEIMNKFVFVPLHASQWVLLTVFLTYPLLVIGVLLAFGVCLSSSCPTVFGLLTGGRG